MHYLLPILNPILEFDIQETPIKLYLIFSGLFSGIYFYFELVKEDRSMLKFSAHRTTRLQKFKIALVPTLKESAEAALYAFKAFFSNVDYFFVFARDLALANGWNSCSSQNQPHVFPYPKLVQNMPMPDWTHCYESENFQGKNNQILFSQVFLDRLEHRRRRFLN